MANLSCIDNFDVLRSLIPRNFDGDTFLYTEILDRSKKAGNNKGRRLRTFYHRSVEEYDSQKEQIIDVCNYHRARAYLRPSPRSFRIVGMAFARQVLDQSLSGNWEGLRHGYSSCCGKNRRKEGKVWTFDFDTFEDSEVSEFLESRIWSLRVPSRKGFHILTAPFDRRLVRLGGYDVELHYDNPTNLYIPSGA